MPLYVYVTDTCRKEATQHEKEQLVEKLKVQIEQTHCLAGFNFYLPTRFITKGLGRNHRLMAYRTSYNDDELILFLRVLGRGSQEYEKEFLKKWETHTAEITQTFMPYSEQDVGKFYETVRKGPPPPPPPPNLNEEERKWLYEVFCSETASDDLLVLETETWVRKMRSEDMRPLLALYHRAIEKMMDDEVLSGACSPSDFRAYWDEESRIGLAYVYWPAVRRLILLEPLRSLEEIDVARGTHGSRLSTAGEDARELSRLAARSYPYYMFADREAWLEIQGDEKANLALSPEEAELLDSIRRGGARGELGYPLFINGRAGSGKSTMLQYLAADYVDFALRLQTDLNARGEKVGRHLLPVYITSSPDLLDTARKTVRGLLKAHYSRLAERTRHNPNDVENILDKCFVVFHEYLRSLLPLEKRNSLSPERYVNFSEFRQLWERQFARRPEAKRMNLEIAWHTIRSYIKGMRSNHDDDLNPEEFCALPRRRRSVSEQTYREVYEQVWERWYKRLCEKEGYWDDQDLAALVLESGVARDTEAAAIFCDEAQDFTPLELDIIFQLCVYAKRSLEHDELKRLPLVFAGDPLQTINPTGFRWEAVLAYFHDRFCAVLDPKWRARINIGYKELHFNYRSNPGIVRFCNLIQMARAALLGSPGIRPQEGWWVEDAIQTVFFPKEHSTTREQLRKRPEFVKVINCEHGQENDYARQDDVLRELVHDSDGVCRNVLGPTRIKGLEFPAVVLYRFAETAPAGFESLLNGERDLRNDIDGRLPFEYFFNRLYVAASRAKGQLIVVDSENAFNGFWRFATDPEVFERLMLMMNSEEERQAWRQAVGYLVRSTDEGAWRGEGTDPREQGAEYASQGRSKRDPYLLRQAALAYRSASDEQEAGRCLALALEFEGRYREAGDRYSQLGHTEDAFRCFWVGKEFPELWSFAATKRSFASRLETRAAYFMTQRDGVEGGFVEEIVRASADLAWRSEVAKDPTWRFILAKLAERLARTSGSHLSLSHGTYEMFKEFSSLGVEFDEQHLALIAYSAGEYADAVKIFERIGRVDRSEYLLAKARIAPFPENILWFKQLQQHEEVLAQWQAHAGTDTAGMSVSDEVRFAVVDTALAKAQWELAADLLSTKPEQDRVVKLLSGATKGGNAAAALKGALAAARLMVRSGSWRAAIRAAEESDFSEFGLIEAASLRELLRRIDGGARVFRAVVEELAEAEELARQSADRQQPVAEFLERTFIGKGLSGLRERGLAPEVVGAAIERAGKIVDALQFYESLEHDPDASEELRRFAAERLVRNNERYADYFRRKNDEQKAADREARSRRIRYTYGIGNRQLPDYPILRKRTSDAEPSEWIHGPFKFVLSRIHGRLRVEHLERFETVTLDARTKALRGDAHFHALVSAGDVLAAWRIPEWEVTIELAVSSDGSRATVKTQREDFDVKLSEARRS